MRAVALHHVNVRVDDVDVATRFYADVLGLRRIDRPAEMPADGVWFAADGDGAQQLHVSDGGGPGDASKQHFCLAVDDWRGAIAALRARGVDVEVREATAQAFIRDPSGNRIELAPSSPSTA